MLILSQCGELGCGDGTMRGPEVEGSSVCEVSIGGIGQGTLTRGC